MKNSFIVSSRILVIAATVLLCLAAQVPASAATTERVSVASDGTQANAGSDWAWVSGDGSCVAFESAASTLVSGDTNASTDIFVHDRLTYTTERVSVASGGAQANGNSQLPCISDDSSVVAFQSYATNLVLNDTNGKLDAFLHDRVTGITEVVSVSGTGALSNGLSGEARVSADGSFVVFTSYGTNLVSGDVNGRYDVFLRDRLAGTTELVSVSTSGAQGNGISGRPFVTADGRYVSFYSDASNLVAGDTNGTRDAFVRDRWLGTTEIVSISTLGAGGNSFSGDPSISDDGRFVAFQSFASNFVSGDSNGSRDIFVRDRVLGTTECVSVSNLGAPAGANSEFPMISGDGRYVSFHSSAASLVPSDSNGRADIFVRDRQTLTTERVSVSSSGVQANGGSYYPHMSADGQFVTYRSAASNLVSGDTNALTDIFVQAPLVGNTPTGTNVPVALGDDIDLTFAEVTSLGDTTVTASETPPHGPPAGFRFLGDYYDIVTTADYGAPITIAFSYDPADIPGNREAKLKIFHYHDGAWVDATVSIDTVNHVIYASVDSLSWFAVGWPEYQWLGFLPPIADADRPFKRGSTIPIKFRIADESDGPVTDAVCTLTIYYLKSGAPSGEAEVVSTAAGDWGDQFRCGAGGDLYIFNLGTKDISFLKYYTYQAEAVLDDGSTHSVDFSLK